MPNDFRGFGGLAGTMVSGGGGGGGSLNPASPYGYTPYGGGKPQVPDPGASAASAINANLQNWPGLSNLITQANALSAANALDAVRKGIPNYDALSGQRSLLLQQQLAGQLPQDVVDLILRRANERGIFTGSPGSQNSNASYLKALGLTSLDLMGKGMAGFSQAIHDVPQGQQMNPASMMITPDAVQQAQMMANYYASMPDSRYANMGLGKAPSYGGLAGAAPVRLGGGGGGGAGPYQFAEPQYGTYAMGGGGYEPYTPNYSSIPTTGIYQGGGQGPGLIGPYGYDDYSSWGGGGFGESNFGIGGAPSYYPGSDFGDYDWGSDFSGGYTGDYNNFGSGYGGYDNGYDPIMNVSTQGPSWWDTINEGSDYYPYSSADFGFE